MARRPYSKLTPAQRGAITKRARAEGKDPKRVAAAYKGHETRLRNERLKASREGQRKRERTERGKAPGYAKREAQRARRIREHVDTEPAAVTRRGMTMADLDEPFRGDDYDVEIEGHDQFDRDTGKKGKK